MNDPIRILIESVPKVSWYENASSILIPIIAIVTTYIAFQQWKTNRNKLRLELYDKRKNVYILLKGLITNFISQAGLEPKEYRRFYNEIQIDKNLFDKNDQKYFIEVYENIKSYSINNIQYKRGINSEDMTKTLIWITEQNDLISERFSKYFKI